MPEDTTSALPDGNDVVPAGGQEAVSTASDQPTGIKEIVSRITGKDFPTDEAAAKSLKDTYAFVGGAGMKARKLMDDLKVKFQKDDSGVLNLMENLAANPAAPYQAPANASDLTVFNEIAGLKKQVEESSFYEERPELKEYRSIIGELRDTTGRPIREVVEMPAVKTLVEKARSHDVAERSRSVLHSNPKLGQVRDKLTEAREASAKGDINTAAANAVGAVMDAFEMGQ